MFAKTAFPSTQTLTQTNTFCSKGEEKSLKSSPHTSAARHGAPHLGGGAVSPHASVGRPHLGWGDRRRHSATERTPLLGDLELRLEKGGLLVKSGQDIAILG